MTLTTDQQQIIEKIGVFFEKKGNQPILGRIIGLLMVIEEAEATFEDIQNALFVSKSAVSQALTLLQSQNKVEYITKPGERKRYFRLKIRNWKVDIQEDMKGVFKFNNIVEEIISMRSDSSMEFNSYLIEVSNFMKFMEAELPKLVERYKNQLK
jgi:DNA-binding transcriptional regulator GbsR (MarR family)